jgi:anti-sigma regulatory factor (Ser/Thr protein kinase)
MKGAQSELRIGGKLENLSVIADFIATTMRQIGVGEEMIFSVQMAVDEACTNIIQHGYSGKGGMIAISTELQGNDFVITIRDRGRPFDPGSVPPPDLAADLDQRRVGGLGIYLMRKRMDDVSYDFDAVKGNKLTMRKTVTKMRPSS